MNRSLFTLLLALLSFHSYASHLAGAELRYEFNGTNYTFYLYLNTECPSVPMPGADIINVRSASLSVNSNITLTQVSSSVTPACASGPTTCQNPSALIPGHKLWVYTGSMALAQANDWVISYSSANRGSSSNMNNSNGYALYTEARLDNSVAINSNPVESAYSAYHIAAGTTNSIPLQAADAEGDSIDYALVTPMASATTVLPYAMGFSLANTMGASGICTVNNTTKMLTLKAPLVGIYIVAIKVREYRNSVLVGSYIRDFVVMALTGSAAVTYPVSTSSYNVYTCPGQVNSVTLNYTDAGGDSVFLTPTTPTISGWSFSTSTTSAAGSGSVTINWTTPSSLNPATLPYFYIKINATDNSCPKSMMDYTLVVRTQQCLSDSVWPGDANGDFTVNIYDPLAIAIANGQTGAARTSPSTLWVAQACMPWTNTFITNNVNMKHADCDGNGTVNMTDLGAVSSNWGLSHPKGNYQHKATGAPPFYFDLSAVSLVPGSTVNIPIKLGDASLHMTGLYGLATKVTVNGVNMGQPAIVASSSWLGTAANTLNFTRPSPNIVYWAHARTDHQEVDGYGTVGTLSFTVPANAKPGTPVYFSFTGTNMVDKNGNDVLIDFDEQEVQTIIPFPDNIGSAELNSMYAVVAPNPSHTDATLEIGLPSAAGIGITVTDMVGKILWKQQLQKATGQTSVSLPAFIAAGMYMVHVRNTDNNVETIVRWVKQ